MNVAGLKGNGRYPILTVEEDYDVSINGEANGEKQDLICPSLNATSKADFAFDYSRPYQP
jgi:hypothetical protein